jgi:hypothetical protein
MKKQELYPCIYIYGMYILYIIYIHLNTIKYYSYPLILEPSSSIEPNFTILDLREN